MSKLLSSKKKKRINNCNAQVNRNPENKYAILDIARKLKQSCSKRAKLAKQLGSRSTYHLIPHIALSVTCSLPRLTHGSSRWNGSPHATLLA